MILGIDAAWTDTTPSGVALVASLESMARWRCVTIAPSYDTFLTLASGTLVDLKERHFKGCPARVQDLLRAARTLAGAPVDVVAVDMPIARVPIIGRRATDQEFAKSTGHAGAPLIPPMPTDQDGWTGEERRFGQFGLRTAPALDPGSTE
jgi:hypothetical protein